MIVFNVRSASPVSFPSRYGNLFIVVRGFTIVLELINATVNIIIYYNMSSVYRKALLQLLRRCKPHARVAHGSTATSRARDAVSRRPSTRHTKLSCYKRGDHQLDTLNSLATSAETMIYTHARRPSTRHTKLSCYKRGDHQLDTLNSLVTARRQQTRHTCGDHELDILNSLVTSADTMNILSFWRRSRHTRFSQVPLVRPRQERITTHSFLPGAFGQTPTGEDHDILVSPRCLWSDPDRRRSRHTRFSQVPLVRPRQEKITTHSFLPCAFGQTPTGEDHDTLVSPRCLWSDPDRRRSRHTRFSQVPLVRPRQEKITTHSFLPGAFGQTPTGEDHDTLVSPRCLWSDPDRRRSRHTRFSQVPLVRPRQEKITTQSFLPGAFGQTPTGEDHDTIVSPRCLWSDPDRRRSRHIRFSQVPLVRPRQEKITTHSFLPCAFGQTPTGEDHDTLVSPRCLWSDPDRRRSRHTRFSQVPLVRPRQEKITTHSFLPGAFGQTPTGEDHDTLVSPRCLWSDPDRTRSRHTRFSQVPLVRPRQEKITTHSFLPGAFGQTPTGEDHDTLVSPRCLWSDPDRRRSRHTRFSQVPLVRPRQEKITTHSFLPGAFGQTPTGEDHDTLVSPRCLWSDPDRRRSRHTRFSQVPLVRPRQEKITTHSFLPGAFGQTPTGEDHDTLVSPRCLWSDPDRRRSRHTRFSQVPLVRPRQEKITTHSFLPGAFGQTPTGEDHDTLVSPRCLWSDPDRRRSRHTRFSQVPLVRPRQEKITTHSFLPGAFGQTPTGEDHDTLVSPRCLWSDPDRRRSRHTRFSQVPLVRPRQEKITTHSFLPGAFGQTPTGEDHDTLVSPRCLWSDPDRRRSRHTRFSQVPLVRPRQEKITTHSFLPGAFGQTPTGEDHDTLVSPRCLWSDPDRRRSRHTRFSQVPLVRPRQEKITTHSFLPGAFGQTPTGEDHDTLVSPRCLWSDPDRRRSRHTRFSQVPLVRPRQEKITTHSFLPGAFGQTPTGEDHDTLVSPRCLWSDPDRRRSRHTRFSQVPLVRPRQEKITTHSFLPGAFGQTPTGEDHDTLVSPRCLWSDPDRRRSRHTRFSQVPLVRPRQEKITTHSFLPGAFGQTPTGEDHDTLVSPRCLWSDPDRRRSRHTRFSQVPLVRPRQEKITTHSFLPGAFGQTPTGEDHDTLVSPRCLWSDPDRRRSRHTRFSQVPLVRPRQEKITTHSFLPGAFGQTPTGEDHDTLVSPRCLWSDPDRRRSRHTRFSQVPLVRPRQEKITTHSFLPGAFGQTPTGEDHDTLVSPRCLWSDPDRRRSRHTRFSQVPLVRPRQEKITTHSFLPGAFGQTPTGEDHDTLVSPRCLWSDPDRRRSRHTRFSQVPLVRPRQDKITTHSFLPGAFGQTPTGEDHDTLVSPRCLWSDPDRRRSRHTRFSQVPLVRPRQEKITTHSFLPGAFGQTPTGEDHDTLVSPRCLWSDPDRRRSRHTRFSHVPLVRPRQEKITTHSFLPGAFGQTPTGEDHDTLVSPRCLWSDPDRRRSRHTRFSQVPLVRPRQEKITTHSFLPGAFGQTPTGEDHDTLVSPRCLWSDPDRRRSRHTRFSQVPLVRPRQEKITTHSFLPGAFGQTPTGEDHDTLVSPRCLWSDPDRRRSRHTRFSQVPLVRPRQDKITTHSFLPGAFGQTPTGEDHDTLVSPMCLWSDPDRRRSRHTRFSQVPLVRPRQEKITTHSFLPGAFGQTPTGEDHDTLFSPRCLWSDPDRRRSRHTRFSQVPLVGPRQEKITTHSFLPGAFGRTPTGEDHDTLVSPRCLWSDADRRRSRHARFSQVPLVRPRQEKITTHSFLPCAFGQTLTGEDHDTLVSPRCLWSDPDRRRSRHTSFSHVPLVRPQQEKITTHLFLPGAFGQTPTGQDHDTLVSPKHQ
ncbi:hypothetical protein RRG08_049346 [Elysia crispata]|uniref:Uncharacterized protein n=1 Tax=Elysia crispata TaxID=231223 RepID=A0AAE0XDQ3_9GAST|nr:hypothetical protein RRG08_049346 [Elysia crispata]